MISCSFLIENLYYMFYHTFLFPIFLHLLSPFPFIQLYAPFSLFRKQTVKLKKAYQNKKKTEKKHKK